MSISYQEKVKCSCGETFETDLFQSISVQENPELKELLLAGEINVVKCSSCFQMLYAERFVLYHDTAEELIAFVYPRDMEAQADDIKSQMQRSFADLQAALPEKQKIAYQPVLVFGLDELCALIHLEEDRTDEADIVSVLCGEMGLLKKKLSKDAARRLGIPTVLPLSGEAAPKEDAAGFRARLIQGLKVILHSNDRLQHYKKLLEQVESNPGWSSRPAS
jgi:hypothetical protein